MSDHRAKRRRVHKGGIGGLVGCRRSGSAGDHVDLTDTHVRHAVVPAGVAVVSLFSSHAASSLVRLSVRQYTSSIRMCANSPLRPILHSPATPVERASWRRSVSYSFRKTGYASAVRSTLHPR